MALDLPRMGQVSWRIDLMGGFVGFVGEGKESFVAVNCLCLWCGVM